MLYPIGIDSKIKLVIFTDEGEQSGPVELFLASAGMETYAPNFIREKIDLDVRHFSKASLNERFLWALLQALMLLSEEDLTTLGIPLGHRRKLLKSIQNRLRVLENPGEIIDSRL